MSYTAAGDVGLSLLCSHLRKEQSCQKIFGRGLGVEIDLMATSIKEPEISLPLPVGSFVENFPVVRTGGWFTTKVCLS